MFIARDGIQTRSKIAVVMLLLVGHFTQPVIAQSGGTELSEGGLEEVIVTAQKRQKNLQDVPIALSVVSEQEIVNRSIVNFTELLSEMPNTAIVQNTSSSPRINIRGVTSATVNNAGLESGIGVQIDDVFLGRPTAFSSNLMDVERVEVLRGPQGTLFGKNTIGGLINIVTRKPSMETEGSFDFTYGDDDLIQARGYLTGPLIEDRLAAKISFTTRDQDGWAENRTPGADDIGGADFWGVRGQLLGTIGDNTTWLLSVEHSEDDSVEPFLEPFSGAIAAFDTDPFDRSIATSELPFFKRDQDAISLKIEGNWFGLDFVSITAYRKTDINVEVDSDYSAGRFIGGGESEEQDQFSQEIRILGGSDTFKWIAGVFYFEQDQDNNVPITVGEDIPPLFFGAVPGFAERSDTMALIDTQSVAVFASAEWLFRERWTLTAGVRYTHEEKDFLYEQTNEVFEIFPGVPVNIIGAFLPPVAPISDSLSDGAWSGDISLAYAVNDNANVYAKIARGFKAGGFDATSSSTPTRGELQFDAEFILNYELGFKSMFANNRVRLNGAVFYSDYTDKQETEFNGISFTTGNAADAEIYGLELDLTAVVTSWFTLSANLGLQNAEFVRYVNAGTDFSGNDIGDTPELTGAVAATFQNRFDNDWGWLLRVDFNHTQGHFSADDNAPESEIDDRNILNGRLALLSPNDRYQIAAWVKNVTDEYEITGFNDNQVLGRWASFTRPRSWGIEFRVNFGG